MPSPLHKTPGIVLRSVKYGETSLVVTIYTLQFGIQSYIVNGVRTHTKKGAGKARLFQPTAILDLVVYHHESSHLNRIRDFQWKFLYENLLSDIRRNAVGLFMMELLSRSLKQPEGNAELYDFLESTLLSLDRGDEKVAANIPLYFSLHLAGFLGFRIDNNYSTRHPYLDLLEGAFVSAPPNHPDFLEERQAEMTSRLLAINETAELDALKMNQEFRRNLLFAYERFYALHVNDFTSLKTVGVLKEIW